MAMTGGTAKLVHTGYANYGNTSLPIRLYVYYKTSQSLLENKSTITCGMYVTPPDPGYDYEVGPWDDWGGSYVGTTENTFDGSIPEIKRSTGAYWIAEDKTFTVTHNDDGTCTATIKWKWGVRSTWGQCYDESGSFDITLPTIARASTPTVSASSVQMKDAVTIYTNRKADTFTHTLTYSFGGSTGTIATGVGASYKWTVPDLVSKISGKTSDTCTITCTTKSGTATVGSKTVTLTLTIPGKSTPTASADSAKMGNEVTLYTNRNSTGFTHTLTYSVGDNSGTIATGVGASYAWTPDKSLASYTGNKTSASCTITCNTYTGSTLVGTSTMTLTLNVPDATVPAISADNIAMGDTVTITMSKNADVYTHDLTYSLKASGSSTVSATGIIASGISSQYQWTVPLILASEIPSATQGIITVTCKTLFNDSTTEVGTETASFTVTVPNNSTTQPKVTMTLSPVSDLPSAFSNVYVAGKSKVKVSYVATSDYSTIKSYHTEFLSGESSENPYTSGILSNAGTFDITGKVTDARGYSTKKNGSINVIEYSRPRIIPVDGNSSIVCKRCNSDKTPDPGGVYLLIQIGRKYSKVVSGNTQNNYCKLTYRYKTDAQPDSEYSTPVELLAKTASTDYVDVILSGVVTSNTTAYDIQLIAEDDVGEKDTVTITIPTAFVTLHSPNGGHGLTIGGYHDPAKYDVFNCFFDAEFQGNVQGRVLGLGALPDIPENSDLNDYKDFGAWAITTDEIAATITNIPEGKAGTLRVWSANGIGSATTGSNIYMLQEYVPYDNYCSWRRTMQLTGDSWVYGTWKVISGIDVVVEQGVTGNWYWRKFASGTAECWRRVSQTKNITTAWNAMYYADCDEVTFPFEFTNNPIVSASVESSNMLILCSYGNINTTKPANLRVARFGSAEGISFTIVYHAIGRWK